MLNEEKKGSGLMYSCYICAKWVPSEVAIRGRDKGHEVYFCKNPGHETWISEQENKVSSIN